MNSTFEKHLKNVTFEQDLSKLDTVEDKIEFCKKFLEMNDALPISDKLPSIDNGYNYGWKNTPLKHEFYHKISTKSTVMREFTNDRKLEAEKYARKEVCDRLMSELLLFGCIERQDHVNLMTDTKTIMATLKVVK